MSNRNTAIYVAFVALIWAYCTYFAGSDGDGTVIDGVPFPAEISMSGARQVLTGGGTRLKFNVVKVYAVGMYIEKSAALSALKAFVGMPGAKLASTQAFFSALIDGKFAKTLLLTFHRSVGSEAVTGALKDSLLKRVGASAVDHFGAALGEVLGDEVAKGTSIYLSCSGERLSIGVGSTKSLASLKEKGLCAGLFDVYLGKSPISPSAKEGIAKGYAARVA